MPGSKKGERRGNARKRTHETPNEVMLDAARRSDRGKKIAPARVEQRIEIARIIGTDDGSVYHMTPKEVLLENMHYFQQAARDWQSVYLQLCSLPNPTEEQRNAIVRAEMEIERARKAASEEAYKAAPFCHPRLAAIVQDDGNKGSNPDSIVSMMLDEIDVAERERSMRLVADLRPKQKAAE